MSGTLYGSLKRMLDAGLVTTPRSAALISIFLVLFHVLVIALRNLEWEPLRRLFNGPNPDVDYLPGQIISLCLGFLPVAAGIIAGGPIVKSSTLCGLEGRRSPIPSISSSFQLFRSSSLLASFSC